MVAKYTSGMTIGSLKKSLVKKFDAWAIFAAGSYPSAKVSSVLANEQWQWRLMRLTCTENSKVEYQIYCIGISMQFISQQTCKTNAKRWIISKHLI